MKGYVKIGLILGIVIVSAIIVGVYVLPNFNRNTETPIPTSTPTSTPQPTPIPTPEATREYGSATKAAEWYRVSKIDATPQKHAFYIYTVYFEATIQPKQTNIPFTYREILESYELPSSYSGLDGTVRLLVDPSTLPLPPAPFEKGDAVTYLRHFDGTITDAITVDNYNQTGETKQ